MSDELSLTGANDNPFALALATVEPTDMTAFDSVVKATNWLPRLTLINSNSRYAKAADWKLNSCHWYVMRQTAEQSIDLGKIPVIVPIACRLKAVVQEVTKDGIKWINYYDPKSPDFQKAMARANTKGETGAFYGPEYLVWVDGAGPDKGLWAHLMCGNTSARNVSAEISGFMKSFTPIKLPARLHDSGKFQYEVFSVEKANQGIQAPPTAEDITARRDKFLAEAKKGVTSEAAGGTEEHTQ